MTSTELGLEDLKHEYKFSLVQSFIPVLHIMTIDLSVFVQVYFAQYESNHV